MNRKEIIEVIAVLKGWRDVHFIAGVPFGTSPQGTPNIAIPDYALDERANASLADEVASRRFTWEIKSTNEVEWGATIIDHKDSAVRFNGDSSDRKTAICLAYIEWKSTFSQ